MFKSVVFYGNSSIGEAEIHMKDPYSGPWNREIRISHFSPPSDRCPPLAVLHTIAPAGVRFKMESQSPPPPSDESPLISLYFACLREKKTAVVTLGEEELHLVAMPSRKNLMRYACFWSFSVVPRLYNSCLNMLNLRCLGIVFDLDETLIVANTMRSFEDKIDALQRQISKEVNPQRITGMLAEIKRYQDDKSILKQYTENDRVVENGKVFEVQAEIVPPLSDGHQLISRPVIRLQKKNIILTRVNPAIRDTSVLVRLRPAWKDLRRYLTTKGRKRFEVYVCTMAERDYALEMWRLLDPEANLINSRELLERIVCVKYGSRKSLLSVFQDGICHPKMALGIDDRLKVWDEKDQFRVHVVPAFAPYYAPQAESNSSIPVLRVARNVACSVRGCFFKEFDEVLLPHIVDVCYEDEMINFQSAPDVGNYLTTEDDTSAPNGNKDPLCNEGMEDVEIERRLKEVNWSVQAVPRMVNNFGPRPMSSLQHDMVSSSSAIPLISAQAMMPLPSNHCSQPIVSWPLGQSGLSEPSLPASPAREEGEVPESELDPDTRRRLLILHHGQDTGEHHGQDTREHPPPPPCSVRPPPLQVSVPPVQLRGSWFPLGEGQLNRAPREFPLEPGDVHFDRNRYHHPSLFHGGENFIHSDRVIHENQRLPVQAIRGDDWSRPNHAALNYGSFSGEDMPMGQRSSNYRDVQLESGWATIHFPNTPGGILQKIAMKFGTKVEFRTVLCDSTELQLSIEAWMLGVKMGEGSGKTRKEAQHQASERALQNLADKYLSNALFDPTAVRGDSNKLSHGKENGFISDSGPFGYPAVNRGGRVTSTSEESYFLDHKLEGSKKTSASVYALKELCIKEGYSLDFQRQPSTSMGSIVKGEVSAQVEIGGQILGKGTGTTWEEAKLQAAEEALGTLKSTVGQFAQKRSGSPRSLPTTPNKHLKQDFPWVSRNIPSSSRCSGNETPVL